MSFSTTICQLPQFFKKEPLLPSIVTQSTSQKFCSLFRWAAPYHGYHPPAIYNFRGPRPFLAFGFPRMNETLWSNQERVGFFPGRGVTSAKSRKCEHMLHLQSCKMTGLAGVWTAGEWGMRIQEPNVITFMKLLCKLSRLFWGTVGDNAREAALHTGRVLGKC